MKSVIDSQLQGHVLYETSCDTCGFTSRRGDTFYDLELPVTGVDQVETSLARIFSEERLCGSNQYYCDQCQRLQDGRRRCSIAQPPPTLVMSLLRFAVTDAGGRVKVDEELSYPLRINLGPFVNPPAASEDVTEPEDSTEGDSSEPIWYRLAAVVLHKGGSAYRGHYICHVWDEYEQKWYRIDDDYVDEIPREYDPLAHPPRGKGKYRKEWRPSNPQAYIVVYRREGIEPVAGGPRLRPDTEATVKQRADEFLRSLACFGERELRAKEQYAVYRALRVKAMAGAQVKSPLAEGGARQWDFVPSVWLEYWATGAFIDPDVVEAPLKDAKPPPSSQDEQPQPPPGIPRMIPSQTILCEHGAVDPFAADRYKVVSPEAASQLFEVFGGVRLSQDAACPSCIELRVDELLNANLTKMRRTEALTLHKANTNASLETSGIGVFVARKFIDKWESQKGETEDIGLGPQDGVICVHGLLQPHAQKRLVHPDVWAFLSTQTSHTGPVLNWGTAECSECARTLEETAQITEARKKRKQKLKDAIYELYKWEGNRPILARDASAMQRDLDIAYRASLRDWERGPVTKGKGKRKVVSAPGPKPEPRTHTATFYLIPADWVHSLQAFLNDTEYVVEEPPRPPDMLQFICTCIEPGLLVDPRLFAEETTRTPVCMVSEKTWLALIRDNVYPLTGEEVICRYIEEGTNSRYDPQICPTCSPRFLEQELAKRANFVDDVLVISGKWRCGKKRQEKINVEVVSSFSDTVGLLKERIAASLQTVIITSAATMALFYNDTELDDDQQTLQSYGVLGGSRINLRQHDIEEEGTAGTYEENCGFKGSALLGNSLEAGPEEDQWACQTCTLHNSNADSVCAACGTTRSSR
eukprot:TRINITY_DN17690_c0_g1_i1.p1 TRINITY_DN17690_c0_g1~~TRINITY_DN17690_c0_g1_i1.p1  ORF type:complete len:869 (-),score=120.64 TRINITY_DN17690_c0_g1_i1:21-2627(-)